MAVVYIYLLGILIAWKRSNGIWPVVSEWVVKAIAFGTPPPTLERSYGQIGTKGCRKSSTKKFWTFGNRHIFSAPPEARHTQKMYLGRLCWIFKAYLQPQASICRFQKSPWKVISGVSIKSIGVLKMIQNQVQTVFDQYLAPGLKYLDTSSVKRWVSQFMLVKKMPSQFEDKYFWTICQLEVFGDLRRVLFCSFAANSQVAATSATFLAKFFQANPHSTGIEQQTKSFIQQESIIQHIAPIPLELNNDQDHKRWSSTKNWH